MSLCKSVETVQLEGPLSELSCFVHAQSSELTPIPCSLDVWQANMQKEGINSQILKVNSNSFCGGWGWYQYSPWARYEGFLKQTHEQVELSPLFVLRRVGIWKRAGGSVGFRWVSPSGYLECLLLSEERKQEKYESVLLMDAVVQKTKFLFQRHLNLACIWINFL